MAMYRQTTGNVMGTDAFDALEADYTNFSQPIHLGYLGAQDIKSRIDGHSILTFSSIEAFRVLGSQYNDAMEGGAREDYFFGNGGNDYLSGNGGADYLNGQLGNDTLYGGQGNDELQGDDGNDWLYAGDGDDKLVGGNHDDFLFGDTGNDSVYGGNGNDQVFGNDGNDLVAGEAGNDNVQGGNGNDVLWGQAGDDTLYGGDGNDSLVGGDGDDYINGGSGIDYYDSFDSTGQAGNDTLLLEAGESVTDKLGSNTFIATEAALIQGNFASTLRANYFSGNYTSGIHFGVLANNNNLSVTLSNGASNPTTLLTFDKQIGHYDVTGTQYNDVFDSPADRVSNFAGGAGDDTFNISFGSVSGDHGVDTLNASFLNASMPDAVSGYQGYSINFDGSVVTANNDNSTLLTVTGVEKTNLVGTYGNDVINGISSDDYFSGANGNDIIKSGDGNDTLDGGLGNDLIEGGSGNDQLMAVIGSDLFKGSSDTVNGGDGDDVIYALSDVHNDYKALLGGAGADRFILDVKGDITLGFEFNTQTLAHFVNAATGLKEVNLDWQKIGADIAFDAAGAALGSIPIAGPALAFIPALAKTGFDLHMQQQEAKQKIVEASKAANEAAKHYNAADWGKVTDTGTRDVLVIKDFQIGLDTITLPKLPILKDAQGNAILDGDGNEQVDPHYGYTATFGIQGNKSGVWISMYNPSNHLETEKHIAFIENIYYDNSNTNSVNNNSFISPLDFTNMILDLLKGNQIGKFSTKSCDTTNDNNSTHGWFSNDVIDGQGGNDYLLGYFGDDVLLGGQGNDTLFGGTGNDGMAIYEKGQKVKTAQPNKEFYDNDGNDFISGGSGDDLVYGGSGDDYLNGGADSENLTNQNGLQAQYVDGNDTLDGGTGNDTLMGGAGNDTLIDTDASVSGGEGTDILIADYSAKDYGAGIHLGYLGEDTIRERLHGTKVLTFDSVEQLNITGTQYSDYFIGGAGNDSLNGGNGNDQLSGGDGADQFLFSTALGATNIDTIADFNVSNDIIALDHNVFAGLVHVTSDNFTIGATAATADEQIIFNADTGALFYDVDGVNGSPALQFATLIGVSDLTAANFMIV